MLRRQSVGQEGATAEFCDLSGRALTTSQVERTLRVFDTAVAIDMSNNELEQIPATIPKGLLALDVSFNLLYSAQGLERLQLLQELHLGFNRLSDAAVLEFCPLLRRVNLSGNRLVNTRGLESLAQLEHLDVSDNLIEHPEALRPLSVNHHLTHLTIRGNPIAHKASTDCRVVVLDMIPSVLILDDKKIRAAAKCKLTEDAPAGATRSLSYSRIYDDKKQFIVRHQQTRRTPASHPAPILLGDPAVSSKYEGNTIFIKTPQATTATTELSAPSLPPNQSPRQMSAAKVAPTGTSPQQMSGSVRIASPTSASGPYMSLYDRLAAANGICASKTTESLCDSKKVLQTSQNKRPESSQSPRCEKNSTQTQPTTRRSVDRGADRPVSRGGPHSRPQTPSQSRVTKTDPNTHVPPNTVKARSTVPTSSTPSNSPAHTTGPISSEAPGPAQHSQPTTPSVHHHLDSKQQNVLSVIQNLIQHKKQTLATLARQSSTVNASSLFSS